MEMNQARLLLPMSEWAPVPEIYVPQVWAVAGMSALMHQRITLANGNPLVLSWVNLREATTEVRKPPFTDS